MIEQPELHAHPKLQAELADVLIESALSPHHENSFLLETHSEHLILRLLRRIRSKKPVFSEKRLNPKDLCVLYVGPDGGGPTKVVRFEVDENGDFDRPWPGGFFEERLPELLPEDELAAWRNEG